jgi:predicted Rossmann fold flavoprotein
MERIRIAVIGGGAAGLMAAGRLGELSGASEYASVTLFEKNQSVGRKLAITGKGRCNVTNNCDVNTFLENVPRNPRFLYSALGEFSPADTIEFFENRGVKLKTERGRRVFPLSDKSYDIVDSLRSYCFENKVKIINTAIDKIEYSDSGITLFAGSLRHTFEKVIIATGGASYPLTGSTGDGYRFARSLGIGVTELRASLVPLETSEDFVKKLMGLSLKNVSLKAFDSKGNLCHEEFGEMLFTHFGVSGPMVLSTSAHLPDITEGKYRLTIDLKPALDEKTLDRRIVSDFEKYKNRNLENALKDLLPSKMIPVFVSLTEIDREKKVNSITREERAKIVSLLKGFSLTVKRTRPISEAIITSGGIDVKEINPKTMESRKFPGIYFAGEIIDVDAYTGGYNLQIAFSSARLAAKSAIYS